MTQESQPKRRGNPALVKGGPSLNPKGRPRDVARLQLEERVRSIVDFDRCLEVLADIAYGQASQSARPADRVAAIKLLADRGFGKSKAALELTAAIAPSTIIDIDALDGAAADILERALLGALEAQIEDENAPRAAPVRALSDADVAELYGGDE